MGDLGQPLQELNCRKRKADGDEDGQHPITQSSQSPTDPILVDRPSPPHLPSHAPRQPPTSPWLSTDAAHGVWPSEHSPTDSPPVSPLNTDPDHARFSKRPRIDTNHLVKTHPRGPERHPSPRASPPHTPTRRSRRRADHRELLSPSPSSPHPPVLRIESHLPSATNLHPASQLPFPHIDLTSPHIPSLHPLINRQTLKELDLSAILRNPQLRTSSLVLATILFIHVQQATTSSSTPGCSSDLLLAGKSASSRIGTGAPSHRNLKMDAHASPLTCNGDHASVSVSVVPSLFHLRTLSSLIQLPAVFSLSECPHAFARC